MRALDNRHQQFEHLLNDCYRYPRSLTEAWPCTPTGLTITRKPISSRDKWGQVPIHFVDVDADTDEIITREFIKGALFAFISAVIVVCIAVASYFI